MKPINLTAAISLWRLNEITGLKWTVLSKRMEQVFSKDLLNLNKSPKTNWSYRPTFGLGFKRGKYKEPQLIDLRIGPRFYQARSL